MIGKQVSATIEAVHGAHIVNLDSSDPRRAKRVGFRALARLSTIGCRARRHPSVAYGVTERVTEHVARRDSVAARDTHRVAPGPDLYPARALLSTPAESMTHNLVHVAPSTDGPSAVGSRLGG